VGISEMHTKFWLENLIQRQHLEDISVYGKIFCKNIGEVWAGFSWLKTGCSGGLL
jgi:hypothetical protein